MKSILVICTLYFSSATAMASADYPWHGSGSNSIDQILANLLNIATNNVEHIPQAQPLPAVENVSSPVLILQSAASAPVDQSLDSEDSSSEYEVSPLELRSPNFETSYSSDEDQDDEIASEYEVFMIDPATMDHERAVKLFNRVEILRTPLHNLDIHIHANERSIASIIAAIRDLNSFQNFIENHPDRIEWLKNRIRNIRILVVYIESPGAQGLNQNRIIIDLIECINNFMKNFGNFIYQGYINEPNAFGFKFEINFKASSHKPSFNQF